MYDLLTIHQYLNIPRNYLISSWPVPYDHHFMLFSKQLFCLENIFTREKPKTYVEKSSKIQLATFLAQQVL